MRTILGVALAILVGVLLIHIGLGSSENIPPGDVIREIFRGSVDDTPNNRIIWSLRLPRAFVCVFAGAILGLSGVIFQSLFRNPLAEPYIVGASSGAAVGGALVQILGLGVVASELLMPVGGFITGMLALALVMSLSRRRGVVETQTMLLAGVVISTMLSALLSLIVLMSGRDQGVVLRWLLGSMSEATLLRVFVLAAVFAIGFPILFSMTRRLNAVTLGEEAAMAVGVNPDRLRNQSLSVVTALVATLVGMVGIVGFVGLVAPHVARRIVGADLRRSLPLATLIGALLVLLSDAIAQRAGGLPVGIVTAILGAPSLLVLLRRA